MDNGSTDDTDVMMREVYPDIIYRYLHDNIGPLAFNQGAELASAPLLFRTDDDAYPEGPTTLERAVDYIEHNQKVVVLAGDIVDERTRTVYNWHPHAARYDVIPDDGLDVGFFYGACAILRKGPFFEAGGFWDKFYLEEADLATRMIANGGDVRYVPWMRVVHVGAYDKRNPADRWLLMSQQIVRYQFRYFPLWRAIWRSAVAAFSQVLLGAHHRLSLGTLMQGLRLMVFSGARAQRRERVFLTAKQLRKVTLGESMIVNTLRYYTAARRLRKEARNGS